VGLSPSFMTSTEFTQYIANEKVKAKKTLTRIGFFK
jgi:tripartite-type tricarboxylate transporter receptor subunit TctC